MQFEWELTFFYDFLYPKLHKKNLQCDMYPIWTSQVVKTRPVPALILRGNVFSLDEYLMTDWV